MLKYINEMNDQWEDFRICSFIENDVIGIIRRKV